MIPHLAYLCSCESGDIVIWVVIHSDLLYQFILHVGHINSGSSTTKGIVLVLTTIRSVKLERWCCWKSQSGWGRLQGVFLFFCLVLHKNEIRIQDDTLNSISLADMSSSLAAYHIYRREKKMFGWFQKYLWKLLVSPSCLHRWCTAHRWSHAALNMSAHNI